MEAKLNNPLHVVSYALNIHVQYVPCFIVKEGDHHEEHTKSKADLAQPADSNFKTTDYRGGGACSYTPDNNDLVGDRDLDLLENAVKSGIHLYTTDS